MIYLNSVFDETNFHRMGPIFTLYIAIFHVSIQNYIKVLFI